MMLSYVWHYVSMSMSTFVVADCWVLTCPFRSVTIMSCWKLCDQPHEILLLYIFDVQPQFSFLENSFKHLFSLAIAISTPRHALYRRTNRFLLLYAAPWAVLGLYWRLSNLLHSPFELNGMSTGVNYARIPTDRTMERRNEQTKEKVVHKTKWKWIGHWGEWSLLHMIHKVTLYDIFTFICTQRHSVFNVQC